MDGGDDLKERKYIFALGFFDGLHLGHQALMKECCALAKQMGVKTAAISFDKHPKSLVVKEPPVLLTTQAVRQMLLQRYGMEQIHVLSVVPEVMGLPWEEFIQRLVERGAVGFVCGDDFTFGYKGLGKAESLTGYCEAKGLPCVVVSEQTLDGKRISSTLIRSCMESGDLESANRYLGHPHVMMGTVLPGDPARLTVPAGIAVPKGGTYACTAEVDGKSFPATARVRCESNVEVEIPDFEGNLAGRELTLEFYRLLPPEKED